PLFIRIVGSLKTTSTFKSRKVDLRNKAYGPGAPAPVYVLNGREEGYVPFYEAYPADVAAGKRPRG
ncbi:MAG: long-chain-acyl-CoA synthetase, partial [Verrucomicrobiae bacterium]|nr:long-chain-acyl-CoA synthetase [Verrucomicrobiae bacterium]